MASQQDKATSDDQDTVISSPHGSSAAVVDDFHLKLTELKDKGALLEAQRVSVEEEKRRLVEGHEQQIELLKEQVVNLTAENKLLKHNNHKLSSAVGLIPRFP